MLCLHTLTCVTDGHLLGDWTLHPGPPETLLKIIVHLSTAPMNRVSRIMSLTQNQLPEILHIWHTDPVLVPQGTDEDIAASDAYTLKSDSSSTWTSFPSRIPETVCTKNDATATYGVRLRRSLYCWKDNFITFPTPPYSGPYIFGVNGNSQNNSTSRIWKGAAPPLLGQWPVYHVGS